jgi:RNA polymerase sigma-70 factor (ECF subfamily)
VSKNKTPQRRIEARYVFLIYLNEDDLPDEGTPSNPAAWITTVAQRRAIDRMRRDTTYEDRLESIAGEQAMKPETADNPESSVPDERLALIFACCHPALAREAQAH